MQCRVYTFKKANKSADIRKQQYGRNGLITRALQASKITMYGYISNKDRPQAAENLYILRWPHGLENSLFTVSSANRRPSVAAAIKRVPA